MGLKILSVLLLVYTHSITVGVSLSLSQISIYNSIIIIYNS